jgi:O-Antigen ligase
LYAPIGYWNALGAFAAMATLMASGLAAAPVPLAARAAAAASIIVTVPTLYLTFSRGALWAAAMGLIVVVAASPARLWLVATLAGVAPWAAGAVLVVERRSALTAATLDYQALNHQGHRAIPWLGACMIGAAATICALGLLAPRITLPVDVRRAIGAVLLAGAILVAAIAVEHRGGPAAVAHSARQALQSPPPAPIGNNANRLGDLSLNGRLDQWRVAWHMFTAHPVMTGGGAGGWEAEWLRRQPYKDYNERSHSLYLETLAELGVVGLGLLALALVPPLLAFPGARRDAGAVAALPGLAVFLAHAAVDWDWQLPAVTVPALLCAACLLGASSPGGGVRLGERSRWALVATLLFLGLAAAYSLQGNRLISNAGDEVAQGDYTAAIANARDARTWLPWSYQPDTWQGEAELGKGNRLAAATSFRNALSFHSDNWRLWFDLARATKGRQRSRALDHVRALYPLSPEVVVFCRTVRDAC